MTMKVQPSEEQAEAIAAISAWFRDGQQAEFLLDGGAGTGKSTVAGIVSAELNLRRTIFGAYTAKAARVMREKGMKDAATLHSLLYRPKLEEGRVVGWTKLGRQSPLASADLIVLDECSFIPMEMAEDIRSFERPMLILGDIDGQLPPPEGRGAFLNRRPDFRLMELNRASAESPITRLAWMARRGAQLPLGGPAEARVERLLEDSWETILNRDYQVICGRHKTRFAVTRRARAKFGFDGLVPSPGEPLICCRNNHRYGLVNGDACTLWRIVEDDWNKSFFIADIMFEGETIEAVEVNRHLFELHQAEKLPVAANFRLELDWAYAITCHKAQGSEWQNVIVIDDKFAAWDKDLRRRWMYTALSRASEKLIVFQAG